MNRETRRFRGTRDFLPKEMIHRERILEKMRTVFWRYGFDPIETPAIEYVDTLLNKYGEDSDKLIYHLDYKSGTKNAAALHYDLTVPLSRVIENNISNLIFPFKKYQVQPVWRADSPQIRQGRFREFYQCDIDTLGIRSIVADAEIIQIIYEVFSLLGLGKYLIKINNRKILIGIIEILGIHPKRTSEICRSIDKLDKLSFDEVAEELIHKEFSHDMIEKLKEILNFDFGSSSKDWKELEIILQHSKIGKEGISEIKDLFYFLECMEIPYEYCSFEITLARGLDYYTGNIFEVVLPDHSHIGSIAGGGRYDNLIHSSGLKIPAVGSSLGLDRIVTAMEQLEILQKQQSTTTRTEVLVVYFSKETFTKTLKLVRYLREENEINTELYPGSEKLGKQFSFAHKKGIRFVIIQGEDELAKGKIYCKDLLMGEEKLAHKDKIVEYIKNKR